MKHRRRIYYSAKQRTEIWDRWQRGESMSSIGRLFERGSSSIYHFATNRLKRKSQAATAVLFCRYFA